MLISENRMVIVTVRNFYSNLRCVVSVRFIRAFDDECQFFGVEILQSDSRTIPDRWNWSKIDLKSTKKFHIKLWSRNKLTVRFRYTVIWFPAATFNGHRSQRCTGHRIFRNCERIRPVSERQFFRQFLVEKKSQGGKIGQRRWSGILDFHKQHKFASLSVGYLTNQWNITAWCVNVKKFS